MRYTLGDVERVAVMRKMIIIAHSLYKNNEKYSAKVYQKACGII